MKRSPTIKDVARKASVSISTVSRVLNNKTGYSEETKVKVLKVIEEIGFHPNGIARGLINQKTKTLGVMLPDIGSSFSSKVLEGIEECAYEHGYSTIICNTGENGKRTVEYSRLLREKKIDGLVYTSAPVSPKYYEEISSLEIPIVLLSSMSYQYPIPYIRVDDKLASYHAIDYLVENGHTEIAMIGGPTSDEFAGKQRYNGYRRALTDHGLSINEELIVAGDYSFNSGKESMEKLLQKGVKFTAVFAASDDMAMGAISQGYDHQLKTPDDISVIGFDNTHLSEMWLPALTTVGQPLKEMGQLAVTNLLKMIESKASVQSTIMRHEIIERKTVRKIN